MPIDWRKKLPRLEESTPLQERQARQRELMQQQQQQREQQKYTSQVRYKGRGKQTMPTPQAAPEPPVPTPQPGTVVGYNYEGKPLVRYPDGSVRVAGGNLYGPPQAPTAPAQQTRYTSTGAKVIGYNATSHLWVVEYPDGSRQYLASNDPTLNSPPQGDTRTYPGVPGAVPRTYLPGQRPRPGQPMIPGYPQPDIELGPQYGPSVKYAVKEYPSPLPLPEAPAYGGGGTGRSSFGAGGGGGRRVSSGGGYSGYGSSPAYRQAALPQRPQVQQWYQILTNWSIGG